MSNGRLIPLIKSLRTESGEAEWVEFKMNNFNPDQIGEYISALSNAAALLEVPAAYLIWGIEDETHNLVGTKFSPNKEKIKGQELESWLVTQISPRVDFRFNQLEIDGKNLVVLEIPAARHTPVRFRDTEYIRVGSYKKKLKEFPEKEASLWRLFQKYTFERDIAISDVSATEVLRLLDYPGYFDLTKQPLSPNQDAILDRLLEERFIISKPGNLHDITNLGATLFAKDLGQFDRLGRKALRVILYRGTNKLNTVREFVETKGYAVGFESAVTYINQILPTNEQIGDVFRKEVRMFPEIAIRELVANSLIHQNFSIGGAGPTVEIYSDRIEITNPGEPLIDPLRFIDNPPRSRNEDIAAFLRRVSICEERGSGIDKVVDAVELFQLPAPDFRVVGNNTVAVLYSVKTLAQMSQADKVRACYQHACLKYIFNERMTNTSLRKRLKINDKNHPIASLIITNTMKEGLIKPSDPKNRSKKHASYAPYWA